MYIYNVVMIKLGDDVMDMRGQCSAGQKVNFYSCKKIFRKKMSICHLQLLFYYEPPRGKTNNVVSEQVRHKPTCTSTEKSEKLEILDLSRRRIVLSK